MSATAGRWTKLYGSLVNGRALNLSRDARLLGIEAECWSDDQETDGDIPAGALRMLTDADDPAALAAELVDGGYWTERKGGGWSIEGFLERHEDSDSRATMRAAESARQRGYRNHAKGQHNADGPRSCKACEATRHAVTTGVTNAGRTGKVTTADSDSDSEATAKRAGAGSKPSRSRSAGAPRSARAVMTKSMQKHVDEVLEGERCLYCMEEIDPDGWGIERKRVGLLDEVRIHKRDDDDGSNDCDAGLVLPDGFGHCRECVGVWPLAMLHDLEDEDPTWGECRPGAGCGGLEAERARRAESDRRHEEMGHVRCTLRGHWNNPADVRVPEGEGGTWTLEGGDEPLSVCPTCDAEAATGDYPKIERMPPDFRRAAGWER